MKLNSAGLHLLSTGICFLMALFVVSCLPAWFNHAPEITVVEYPGETDINTDIKLTCQATDIDGDMLRYQWQCDYGKISGEGAAITWTSPEEPGVYTTIVIVKDGRSAEATRRITLRVLRGSQALPATNLVINLQDTHTKDAITLKPVIVRPAAEIAINYITGKTETFDSMNYTWTTNGGKFVGPGLKENRASAVAWYSPGVPGDYLVNLSVADSSGTLANYVLEFTVKNPSCCER